MDRVAVLIDARNVFARPLLEAFLEAARDRVDLAVAVVVETRPAGWRARLWTAATAGALRRFNPDAAVRFCSVGRVRRLCRRYGAVFLHTPARAVATPAFGDRLRGALRANVLLSIGCLVPLPGRFIDGRRGSATCRGPGMPSRPPCCAAAARGRFGLDKQASVG